ncbi:Wzy polymerase domain-containing protein [Roseateles sp. BYS180W]|uniref:Wzy polymerase domain-containing protein n=1 Tax=Roseateles rivi TaxID=3299028 RepID=A0ABW7FT07_9BURK
MIAPALPADVHRPPAPLLLGGLLFGVVLAPLLAVNHTPSATLYNQLLALWGWGLLVCALATQERQRPRWGAVELCLSLLLLAAALAPLWRSQPLSIALGQLGMLGAALVVFRAACGVPAAQRLAVWEAFAAAVLALGLCSALVALVQVFAPDWADGVLIARSGLVGRAVGNIRQPNHLASILMWAAVALAALWQSGALQRWLQGSARLAALAAWALMGLLMLAMVLSASRTGVLGVLMLAVWGGLDRRLLSGRVRLLLVLSPLLLALAWWGMSWWSAQQGLTLGAESRLAEGAGSPSRVAILRNAWALLQAHPWLGVGWGEFNLAWTLTPFPDRPIAFFDHTHNLPLQWLVELGWPLGLLCLGLLGWGLWQAVRQCAQQPTLREALALRSALMLVLTIGLHSLLEYPLWYAYFLLPAVFALGLVLGSGPQRESRPTELPSRGMLLAGVAMSVGALLTAWDYQRVVEIYQPSARSVSLSERIARGQQSWFFAAQANYAAATSPQPSAKTLEAARMTAHHLSDVRLLMAWAKSLHAVGKTDEARYVVQRLREFRSRAGDDWLQVCEDLEPGQPEPFQCALPSRDYDWTELR